jgi:hypothetical protein
MSQTLKWLSLLVGAAVIVGVAYLWLVRPPRPVGEINVLESGPYRPGTTIILSLPVEARGTVIYKWMNPDGGEFSSPTDGSSTRFVVPSGETVRVICAVTVDGVKYERMFPVRIDSSGSSGKTSPPANSSTEAAAAAGDVLSGVKLARGLDMGVDTSARRYDWVSPTESKDAMRLAFPGDPAWGAVFITVGKPRDKDRPGADYSGFGNLEVDLRGENGDESVDIGIKDRKQPDDGSERKLNVRLTSTWKTYRLALQKFEGADLKQLYVVCEVVFGEKPATVYLRSVRYTK